MILMSYDLDYSDNKMSAEIKKKLEITEDYSWYPYSFSYSLCFCLRNSTLSSIKPGWVDGMRKEVRTK